MKKKLLVIILSLILLNRAYAQVENALYFDGIDDQVIVQDASALISGSSQISMSCWIYPENSAPSFPDYDGFCGFRNDVDADFYLVQITPSRVEARFRNSAGASFDIIDSSLQLNTWQHYILSFDGSTLYLYRNGILVGSIAASGTINNVAVDFYIGDLLYSFTDYYLQGKIDEVSLWNKALNANEAFCIYKSYIDSLSVGLQLYYKFNQGIAGGNNTSVNTLLEANGGLAASLINFGLIGTLSNWVAGNENYTSIVDDICPGQTISFGSQTITAPGVYFENFTGWSGCDSLVRMDVSPTVDLNINISGIVLTAVQSGATYQWVDCDNGFVPIVGEVSQTFIPHANGNYGVILTYNGCTDTSLCMVVLGVGINHKEINNGVNVFPNPFNEKIVFTNIVDDSSAEITDVRGKKVFSFKIMNNQSLDLSFLEKGVYIITLTNGGKVNRMKLIKE